MFSFSFLLWFSNTIHWDLWNKIQVISRYGCTLKGRNQFFINLLNGGWTALEEILVEASQAVHNNAATIWVKSRKHQRNLYSATGSTLRFLRHVRQKHSCISPFKGIWKHYWSQLQKQPGSNWGENTTIKHRFAFSDWPFNVTTSLWTCSKM